MTGPDKKEILKEIFDAAINAASPYNAVHKKLRLAPIGKRLLLKAGHTSIDLNRFKRIFVVGGGKAVCPMAMAVEELLGGRITGGLIVTKYGHSQPLKKIRTIKAGHPIPDGSAFESAE